MSLNVAKKLGLNLAKRSSSPDNEFYRKEEQVTSDDEITRIVIKTKNYHKYQEVQRLKEDLQLAKRRIRDTLTEANISPDLDSASDTNFDFNPLLGTHYGLEEDPTEALKEQAESLDKLLNHHDKAAENKKSLIGEIYQGLMIVQASFGGRNDLKAFEKKMLQREKEANKSFHDAMVVINKVMESFSKLRGLAGELFEKDDTRVSATKFTHQTKTELTEQIRQTNEKFDQLRDTSARLNYMKTFFLPTRYPSDVASLVAEISADETEQHILLEITKNWQDVSKEIIDIFISVHETKMLKRSTRLLIRRALYLYKMIVVLLGMRTNEVKVREAETIALKEEISGLKCKIQQVNKDLRTSKENVITVTNKNARIIKEKLDLANQFDYLERMLDQKEDLIEDLHAKIGDMAAEQAATMATVGSNEKALDMEALNEEKARVKKLKESQRKLSDRLEEVEKELKDLKEKNQATDEKEKFASIEALIKAENTENQIERYQNKVNVLKKSLKDTTTKLRIKEDDYDRKENELSFAKLELKRKENLVENLMGTVVELEGLVDSHQQIGRKISKKLSIMAKPARKSSIDSKPKRNEKRPAEKIPRRKDAVRAVKKSTEKIATETQPTEPTEEKESEGFLPTSSNRTNSGVRSLPSKLQIHKKESSKDVRRAHSDSALTRGLVFQPSKIIKLTALSKMQLMKAKLTDEDIEKLIEEKSDLLEEVESLHQMIQNLKGRLKSGNENTSRHLRLQMMIEAEKQMDKLVQMYGEFLRIETMVNRYRCRISDLFGMNQLQEAAKLAVTAFDHNSPLAPEEYLSTVQLSREKLQSGFEGLYDAVLHAVKRAVQTQQSMQKKHQDETRQESLRSLKLIASKDQLLSKLEKDFKEEKDARKLFKEKFEDSQHNLEVIEEIQGRLKMEKKGLLIKLDRLNTELQATRDGSLAKKEIENLVKMNSSLEAYLNEANENYIKYKRKFAETIKELALAKRSNHSLLQLLHYNPESGYNIGQIDGLQGHSKSQFQLTFRDGASQQQMSQFFQSYETSNISGLQLTAKEQAALILPKSLNGRCAFFMEKISEEPRFLINVNKYYPNISKSMRTTSTNWRNCIAGRFEALVRKYWTICRYRRVLGCLQNEIVDLTHEVKKSNSNPDLAKSKNFYQEIRKRMEEELKFLKDCYWKLQLKLNELIQRKPSKKVVESRRSLIVEMRKITNCITDIYKKGILKRMKFIASILQKSGKTEDGESILEAMYMLVNAEKKKQSVKIAITDDQIEAPAVSPAANDETSADEAGDFTLHTGTDLIIENEKTKSWMFEGELPQVSTEFFPQAPDPSTVDLSPSSEDNLSLSKDTLSVSKDMSTKETVFRGKGPKPAIPKAPSGIKLKVLAAPTPNMLSSEALMENETTRGTTAASVNRRPESNVKHEISAKGDAFSRRTTRQPPVQINIFASPMYGKRLTQRPTMDRLPFHPKRCGMEEEAIEGKRLRPQSEDAKLSAISGFAFPSTFQHHKAAEQATELPKVFELDVRQDLRHVRKVLQSYMRNVSKSSAESALDSTQIRQSTEALLKLEERLKLHQRRQALMYLGVEDKRAWEVKMNADDLIAKVKNQYRIELKKAAQTQTSNDPSLGSEKIVETNKKLGELISKSRPFNGDLTNPGAETENNYLHVGLSPSGSVKRAPSELNFKSRPATARSLIKRFREEQARKRPLSDGSSRRKTAQSQSLSKTNSSITHTRSSITWSSNEHSRTSSGPSSARRERRPPPRVCFR